MYLLDTDHLSVLERGGAEADRLRRRLQTIPPNEVAATVVSYEEQTRGWLSFIARARSPEEQVTAYGYLQRHLQVFCAVPLIGFDIAAAGDCSATSEAARSHWNDGSQNSEHCADAERDVIIAKHRRLSKGTRASGRRLDYVNSPKVRLCRTASLPTLTAR